MHDFIVTGSIRALLISYVQDQAKELMTAYKDYQQDNINLSNYHSTFLLNPPKLGRILGQTVVPTSSTYSDLSLTAGTWTKENLILKICHIQTEWCLNEILSHWDREEGSPWGGAEIVTTRPFTTKDEVGVADKNEVFGDRHLVDNIFLLNRLWFGFKGINEEGRGFD